MKDHFENHQASLESPATRLFAVSPSDAENLPFVSRALSVGADGFVQVTTLGGDQGRIYVVAGAPFPIRAKRVWATGTTATNIVALA